MKKPTTLNKTLLILTTLALLVIKGFAGYTKTYNGGTVDLIQNPSTPLNGSFQLDTSPQTLHPFAVTGVDCGNGGLVTFVNGEFVKGQLHGNQPVDLADGQTVDCQANTLVEFFTTGSGGAKQATPLGSETFDYFDGFIPVTCQGGQQVTFWPSGALQGLTLAANDDLFYTNFNSGRSVPAKGGSVVLFTANHQFVQQATLNGDTYLLVNEHFTYSMQFEDNTVVTFGETPNMTDLGTTVATGTLAADGTPAFASPGSGAGAGALAGTFITFDTSLGNVFTCVAKAGFTLPTATSTHATSNGENLTFSGGILTHVNGAPVP